jgi:addiction module HigA family antidote
MTEVYERGAVTRAPTHPGAILREDVLPALGVSKAEFARRVNISRPMLYDILNEARPVTIAMALRLGKVLGNGPNIWIGMQQRYDLFHTAQNMAEELDQLHVIYG